MKKAELRAAARRLTASLRAHAGDLIYCGGVALALTAIAFAAEGYRRERAPEAGQSSLPAIEFSAAEPQAQDELRAPEGAQLLRGYSELPAWNGALGLWESHPALDYRLADDAAVSLSAGTVRTVGRSGVYGGFVEVECGELLLRYASIVPREGLEPGDSLRPGDPIGTASEDMPGESALGPHLHLEASRGGALLDFSALARGD